MADFLKMHEGEMRNMDWFEYDAELEKKVIREEAYEDGEAAGMVAGESKANIKSIRSLMKTLNMTAQQAMNALQIPLEEQVKYAELI